MMILLFILLLSCFHVTMIDYLYNNPTYYQLDAYTSESEDFRSMKIGKLLTGSAPMDCELLTTLMVEHSYDLTDLTDTDCHTGRLMAAKPAQYRKLKQAYEAVFDDLKYYPVPESIDGTAPPLTYENGWMEKRTYGGERGHEGCDIMGNHMPRGYYPVVTMTDGVVEKVGWLEKGGWRIGIRAPKGAYFYYAHLYGYSREWKEGDTVSAGELLGFMGDTGYSAVEGTTGNFDVHLHVGIYLKTDHMEEMSVNPYWVLKYLEKYRLRYSY